MGNLVQISPGMTVAAPHADRFRGLLNDLNAAGYAVNPQQSGGYNYRTIDGTSTLSQHAFGRAVDVNWDRNARGTRGDIPPDLARSLAAKHGLTWGGDWKNPDPMHFEVAGGGGASVPVGQRSFMNYAGMQKSAPEQPNEDQQRMSLGGPMPAPYQYQQPQQGGLLDSLASRIQSPLAQQGIGLFLSAAQGNDMNQGMNAGAQRANAAQENLNIQTRNLLQQLEAEKARNELSDRNAISRFALSPQVNAMLTTIPPQLRDSALAYVRSMPPSMQAGALQSILSGSLEQANKINFALEDARISDSLIKGNPLPSSILAQQHGQPPANAKRASDGNLYVPDPNRPGKYLMWKE